jgi:hypothetical protein
MTGLAMFMPTAEYAEAAVYTTAVYCLTCGPVLREHLPNNTHITYHILDEGQHPHQTVAMPEEDTPTQ